MSSSGPDDATTYYNVEVLEQGAGEPHAWVRRVFPPPPGQDWPFESFAALKQLAPEIARALLEGGLLVAWRGDEEGAVYELGLTLSELAQDFPAVTEALTAQGVVLQLDSQIVLRVTEVTDRVPPQQERVDHPPE